MSIDIRNYDSRNDFILDLKLWHHNKTLVQSEFINLQPVKIDYSKELNDIKENIDQVKKTWNDQSIASIRKHIENSGNEESLAVMKNQENDKLNSGISISKSMYHVSEVDKDSVWQRIGEQYPFINPLVRLHIQFPGDVTQWHTDIFAPFHNLLPNVADVKTEDIGKDLGIRRILIALEDWDWGQCFMFGADVWHQWHAGDVIFWNYGIPHCASNMGFTPRISLSVTGLLSDNINSYKYVK